jgi:hypothetical protein
LGDLAPLFAGTLPTVLAADLDSNTLFWNDPTAGTLMRAALQ